MRERVGGKVTLVTGGGSGIGQAVCVRLAEEGAEVIVTSRTGEHVKQTCEEVTRACGRRPTSFLLDVSNRSSVDTVMAEVSRMYGRIDVLSNNAGIELPRGPTVEETTDEEWANIFRVNVSGTFWVCRAALPLMQRGASIVNMASINSFVAWPNNSSYTASKGAVLQFTRALSLEVAARGIRANCVCPGVIDTPLTRMFLERAEHPDVVITEYRDVAPMRRLGTPREVADCVLFLASDESSFVTGSALIVDGGATASI
jgi:NAD(P)-dependent dehydrogenase (short-subunit alcohol dehydrogenase family)